MTCVTSSGSDEAAGPPLDLRLVPTALGTWLACGVGVGLGAGELLAAAAALGTGATLAAVLRSRVIPRRGAVGRPWAGEVGDPPRAARDAAAPAWPAVVLVLAVVAVALLGCAVQLAARERGGLARAAAERAVVAVDGVVRSGARPAASAWEGDASRWTVEVSVDRAVVRGVEQPGGGVAVVLGDERWAGLAVGTRLGTTGRSAPTDPGDEAVALVVATGGPAVLDPPGPLLAGVAVLRAGLLEATAELPGDARGLVPGAAVGDTSRVPADLATAMRTSGLTHVTAVSGAHVAVLGVAVLALTAGLPRTARAAACGLVLAGFVLLVGPEPSVVRAAGMGAVALAGLAAGRRSRALPALAATVTVLLAVDPWLARSYGFALSVVATAAIVLLAPALARRLPGRVPRWAAVALAVPVAAQAACAPVLVLLDPGVSLVAVPANLAAAPAVAPATLLGLAATLAAPVAPPLAEALADLAALPSGWIGTVARTAAGLEGARLPWPGGPGGALLLGGVTALALALVLARRAPALRGAVGGVLALVLVLMVPGATAPLDALAPGGGPPAGWRVVQCDVGQGDALVVRTGAASAVVVDVGPDGPAAGACLDALGVERVDLLVLTHHHADHVGGLAGVLAGRDVERALVSPLPEPAGQARRTLDALAAAGVPVDVGLAGAGPGAAGDGVPDGEGVAGDVAWTVLWPVEPRVPVAVALDPPAAGGDGDEANDASIVVDLRAPGVGVLALGDLEPAAQERLADLLPDVSPGAGGPSGAAVDVVKVAHHGSAHQSARLAQALAPAVALVSAGAGNTYGHPAPPTVELYRATGALVLTTDRCGTVTVAEEGDRLRVWAGCL